MSRTPTERLERFVNDYPTSAMLVFAGGSAVGLYVAYKALQTIFPGLRPVSPHGMSGMGYLHRPLPPRRFR